MTVQKIVKYKQRDGEIELKLNVLEDSGNYLIHRDILRHQLSQKQGTVATKTRSEVRGGGKNPWQQKGTGRARAGSSRSPLWRGGGVIFGPKPKTTSLKLNKKERKLAVQTLLYNKLKNTQISIEVDQMIEATPKTKDFCTALKKSKLDVNQKTLLVVSKKTNYLKKSSQNLKNIELISASNLNTLSLLKAKQILITPLALNEIKEIYCD